MQTTSTNISFPGLDTPTGKALTATENYNKNRSDKQPSRTPEIQNVPTLENNATFLKNWKEVGSANFCQLNEELKPVGKIRNIALMHLAENRPSWAFGCEPELFIRVATDTKDTLISLAKQLYAKGIFTGNPSEFFPLSKDYEFALKVGIDPTNMAKTLLLVFSQIDEIDPLPLPFPIKVYLWEYLCESDFLKTTKASMVFLLQGFKKENCITAIELAKGFGAPDLLEFIAAEFTRAKLESFAHEARNAIPKYRTATVAISSQEMPAKIEKPNKAHPVGNPWLTNYEAFSKASNARYASITATKGNESDKSLWRRTIL